ncbi:Sterol 3-beta-glucosyltransferase [Plenodomus lingam]|uniref:Sterol 3-beta-glucosyltransferase n=1 Tax=Leptosphaeria maculans TaxID=5022 RepID=ATG26_LEPMC|nr:RecName: Full=Sterol 3-beta-glucosyltransferase; AltName: Full=Autophagy-related protein 26; AltName: Full=UDP-glycosyltransferase 51 [Plenodomus lingam]AAM81359.1 UDP-glucose:sterol glycosyltransferase [Plenodomus lingam]KAH9869331.1 Sterol 3-beta-glucosyltransferase [Plenodomus lingam]
MASQDRGSDRTSRRLTKKRKDGKKPMRDVSLDMPERFKDGDDAHEDVTAPKGNHTMSMNQSIFSMIARAGQQSNTDLGTMQEVDSGDSDDEGTRNVPYHILDGAARLSRLSTANDFQKTSGQTRDGKTEKGKHRRALSENKLLRSLPKLKIASRKDARSDGQGADQMSSSQFLPPRPSPEGSMPAPASSPPPPAAKGRVRPGDGIQMEKGRNVARKTRQRSPAAAATGEAPVSLAKRIQHIFEFAQEEEVISEYPCWLLQSILLQGYMYITQKHICFYAYIPKKHHDVSKTGYLSKRGRSKHNRYWFILRGDVLAYYTNPAELYFPRNRINLQYAISAEVLEPKRKGDEETSFVVTTDERTYQFKADSVASAREWVKSIQKVIFRTHNEGNSVKISLPIQNVLEIEESSILDFAETAKVRVIDNDETFAIDEYFFSFFTKGQDALNVLRIMINDNEHHQAAQKPVEPPSRALGQSDSGFMASTNAPSEVPHITENVRATLSPLTAPHVGRSSMSDISVRSSVDANRKNRDVRRSMDAGRTLRRWSLEGRRLSHEAHRSPSPSGHDKTHKGRVGDRSPKSPRATDSDSATFSLDPGTESSAAIQSMDDSTASASQILDRSDLFRAPVVSSPNAFSNGVNMSAHSQDTTRSSAPRPAYSKGTHPTTSPSIDPLSPGAPDGEYDTDAGGATRLSGSSSALQDIASYPLQKASGLAGFLRTRSKKMGNLLAAESMGYYEKVSGMLAGGRKHYNTAEGLETDDQVNVYEDDEDAAKATDNFREHFAFREDEVLQSSFFASLQRVLPNYGKIYISGRYFCFRSLMPTSKTKIILPMKDIENVNKEKGFRLGYYGLAIVIRGHEELFFEFGKAEYRDECAITVLRILENTKYLEDDQSSSSGVDSNDEAAKAEHDLLQQAREDNNVDKTKNLSEIVRAAADDRIPLIFDDPLASFVDFKPPEPLTIVCLTIGSRGDVQPYIALCKELLKEGHKPRIATHAEFEPWVRKHGIDFAPVDGNPAELMRICVEHGMFTYNFMKEANSKFRGWLDDVCSSSWRACQGADVLIESPSTMAGIHIAEALEIPYFRAFTMPWTRTRAYPHAFSVLEKKMGGGYNSITYITFDTIFWTAISGQINKWRRRELGLQNTSQSKMQASLRPFLYNFSPHVVPPPLDWPDWVRVTGYWFLDEADTYEPPADLVAFMDKARKDGKKLVYVGFGSIVIDDPAALTKTVVDSVLKADVRCVLSKGWSDRLETKDASKPEIPLPSEIFQIQSAPHDWLFKQMDAAVHHGGSGTTGASLRAGIPTIIKPFFGDQYFFAQRVEDMGVGVWLKKVNTSVFSRALWEVTNSQRMIVKARVLGQKIRKDNGTQVAIQTIYRELDRARSLVKKHAKLDGELSEEFEEDWTMVEDGEEIDVPHPFEVQQPVAGISQDASKMGGGSLVLGSMVLKGAQKRSPESAYRG